MDDVIFVRAVAKRGAHRDVNESRHKQVVSGNVPAQATSPVSAVNESIDAGQATAPAPFVRIPLPGQHQIVPIFSS
jgi:hypothetical protein